MPFTIHEQYGTAKAPSKRLPRINSESLEPRVLIRPGRDHTDGGRRLATCGVTCECDLRHVSGRDREVARIAAPVIKITLWRFLSSSRLAVAQQPKKSKW